MNLLKIHGKDVGIDLGTSSIVVVLKDKGIVRNEPDIIAIEKKTNKILAVGSSAKEMMGKTPEKIEALMPLQHAGIADLYATEMIMKSIIKGLQETENIGNPRIVINLHIGMNEVEKRAVYRAAMDSGAREVYFIEETLAAAIGANLDTTSAEASMIVDIGSGTTEVAVIALGKIASCNYVKIAGDDLDKDIIEYIRKKMNIEIGKNAAERIKLELASVKPVVNQEIEVKGRDLISGLPKTITISAFQVHEAIKNSLAKIVDCVREALDRTPPELLNDVHKKGLTITGGGACIDKIEKLFEENLRITTSISERPRECVALGIHKILNDELKMKELKAKRRI